MRGRALLLTALGYAVILELLLMAAVAYWPQFRENVLVLRGMAPLPALREMIDLIAEGGVVPYVAGQHFFKGANTLGTLAAVLFAVGAIAGEAHRGTLEIVLARPYSRLRVLTARWIEGALAVLVPVFLTTATIPWMEGWAEEEFELYPLLLCAVHQSALLLALYGVTFFLSAIGSNPIKIAVAMLFFSTFSFAIYFVKQVTHASLYRLTDIEDFMRIHDTIELDWRVCGPLLGIALAAYVAAVYAFRRRVP